MQALPRPEPSGVFHASISATNDRAGGSTQHSQEVFDRSGIERGEVIPMGFQVLGLLSSAFGDGSDGDHTVAGTETLTRDMYYRNLTVPAATVLVTDGFRVFVTETLSVEGTIHCDGGNGSATLGGVGGGNIQPGTTGVGAAAVGNGRGTIGCGSNGGGNLGSVGGAAANSKGGTGATAVGPVLGGTVTLDPVALGYVSLLPFVLSAVDAGGDALNGGSGGGGHGGGGGGGGGGVVVVIARAIIGAGTIRANGGNAFGASGGRGGGGFVLVGFATLEDTVVLAALLGAGTGQATAGTNGQVLRAHIVG